MVLSRTPSVSRGNINIDYLLPLSHCGILELDKDIPRLILLLCTRWRALPVVLPGVQSSPYSKPV